MATNKTNGQATATKANNESKNGVNNHRKQSKTAQLQDMIKQTAFSVRTSGGRYIFERKENDGTFIPDYQILPNFDAAWEWADQIAKTTALHRLDEEMRNLKDAEGARFKIGDRVRMKHDGATGTVVRVTEALPDVRFNYEVRRDVPVEGFEPGSEMWVAFPVEDGLEPLQETTLEQSGEITELLPAPPATIRFSPDDVA